MAEAETALQMGARHVAEQEAHVSEQEQFIARLRRHLEPDPRVPRHLHTVRGAGYRLTP